jgi:hypothetical protein
MNFENLLFTGLTIFNTRKNYHNSVDRIRRTYILRFTKISESKVVNMTKSDVDFLFKVLLKYKSLENTLIAEETSTKIDELLTRNQITTT